MHVSSLTANDTSVNVIPNKYKLFVSANFKQNVANCSNYNNLYFAIDIA